MNLTSAPAPTQPVAATTPVLATVTARTDTSRSPIFELTYDGRGVRIGAAGRADASTTFGLAATQAPTPFGSYADALDGARSILSDAVANFRADRNVDGEVFTATAVVRRAPGQFDVLQPGNLSSGLLADHVEDRWNTVDRGTRTISAVRNHPEVVAVVTSYGDVLDFSTGDEQSVVSKLPRR